MRWDGQLAFAVQLLAAGAVLSYVTLRPRPVAEVPAGGPAGDADITGIEAEEGAVTAPWA